jgi:hypothetical protein
LETEYNAAVAKGKMEVARLEASLASLPKTILGKTEDEMLVIWTDIKNYFGGSPPVK